MAPLCQSMMLINPSVLCSGFLCCLCVVCVFCGVTLPLFLMGVDGLAGSEVACFFKRLACLLAGIEVTLKFTLDPYQIIFCFITCYRSVCEGISLQVEVSWFGGWCGH